MHQGYPALLPDSILPQPLPEWEAASVGKSALVRSNMQDKVGCHCEIGDLPVEAECPDFVAFCRNLPVGMPGDCFSRLFHPSAPPRAPL